MATCPECRKTFPDNVGSCPDHGLALLPESVFANEDRTLEAGAHLGDYVVEALLGEGAFGKVYRAVHPAIGRRVAVKVLSRALSTDPHAASRFLAEARAIVEVANPYIVDVYSFGALPDGRQYYVMELLDGMTLDELLRARGRLDVPTAMRILAGMAEALGAAHRAGVVHRDLKPENVLIVTDTQGDPWPKLLDFGVAKLLGDRKLGHRTSTGALVGTPTYMAPEQALGLEVDQRADLYAFGIVAFEMLAGRAPFEAQSLGELIRQHACEVPPRLSAVRPELGTAFDEPLARLLEKDPALRPDSAQQAFRLLREASGQAGHDFSMPRIPSLRPAPVASSPELFSTVDGEAPTERARAKTVKAQPLPQIGTVDGATHEIAPRARSPHRRARSWLWVSAAGALLLVAGAAVIFSRAGEPLAGGPSAAGSGSPPLVGTSSAAPTASDTAAQAATANGEPGVGPDGGHVADAEPVASAARHPAVNTTAAPRTTATVTRSYAVPSDLERPFVPGQR